MIAEVEKGELAVMHRKILIKDFLPYCKNHGAMIRVTPAFENNFSIWRCPICHVGCLYDNNTKDVHSAFFDGTPKKHSSQSFEETYHKLQSLLSRKKIGYRVLGLSSLYIQGFDVRPHKLIVELNKDCFEQIKAELNGITLLEVIPVDKKIERFEVESIKEMNERIKVDEALKKEITKNSKNDETLKKFFKI